MADASVRSASPDDAEAIAAAQATAWRSAYADLLPAEVLEAAAGAADRWRESVAAPPSPRHQVLVAVAGDTVTGFAAFAPAEDPDLDAAMDAELLALCVRPEHAGRGHGSRLVNAAVDHLRVAGFTRVTTWLPAIDGDALGRFLVGSGWGPDGARRVLDLHGDGAVQVRQVRLSSSIGATS